LWNGCNGGTASGVLGSNELEEANYDYYASCSCTSCPEGFEGDNCEIESACTTGPNNIPCFNGGTHTGTVPATNGQGCTCICTNGYVGDNCETKVGDCLAGPNNLPCQNGGIHSGTEGSAEGC